LIASNLELLRPAIHGWRSEIDPQLMACLPVPGETSPPRDVRVSFAHHTELSTPAVQRYVVTAAEPVAEGEPVPTEIQACLDALVGTSFAVDLDSEAAAASPEHHELLPVAWG
jgi:hypothetical protein